MKILKCPHCHEAVPAGATVCKGCQAEVEYGTPSTISSIIFIISISIGIQIGFSWNNGYLGLGAGIIMLTSLLIVAAKIFSNRVVFKRTYK